MDSPHIMVVDDQPAHLTLLEQILSNAGYHVHLYLSASQAFEGIEKFPPHLILLDILMPEIDGYNFCRQLQSRPALKEIPVLFLSVHHDPETVAKGFELGGVDYITKPFHENEIPARIRAHLRTQNRLHHLQNLNRTLEQQAHACEQQLGWAHERLRQAGERQSDWLRVMSYEMRDSVNGLLGSGELLVTEQTDPQLIKLFKQSGRRIESLIKDSELIAATESTSFSAMQEISLAQLCRLISQTDRPAPETGGKHFCFQADVQMLQHAMDALHELVGCFQKATVKGMGNLPPGLILQDNTLLAEFVLGDFPLSPEQAESFFSMSSPHRSATKAETLGLAPVAALKVLERFGAQLSLRKTHPAQGVLSIKFPLQEI